MEEKKIRQEKIKVDLNKMSSVEFDKFDTRSQFYSYLDSNWDFPMKFRKFGTAEI